MNSFTTAQVQNIINEMSNQVLKDEIDSSVAKTLMNVAINRLNLLMTHIGHLEEKLESTIESNRMLAVHAENIIAENQRLQQIAKY